MLQLQDFLRTALASINSYQWGTVVNGRAMFCHLFVHLSHVEACENWSFLFLLGNSWPQVWSGPQERGSLDLGCVFG